MDIPKIYYTVEEAGKALNFGNSTMYKLCHREDFPAVRVGRRIRIPVASLAAWAAKHAGEVVEL